MGHRLGHGQAEALGAGEGDGRGGPAEQAHVLGLVGAVVEDHVRAGGPCAGAARGQPGLELPAALRADAGEQVQRVARQQGRGRHEGLDVLVVHERAHVEQRAVRGLVRVTRLRYRLRRIGDDVDRTPGEAVPVDELRRRPGDRGDRVRAVEQEPLRGLGQVVGPPQPADRLGQVPRRGAVLVVDEVVEREDQRVVPPPRPHGLHGREDDVRSQARDLTGHERLAWGGGAGDEVPRHAVREQGQLSFVRDQHRDFDLDVGPLRARRVGPAGDRLDEARAVAGDAVVEVGAGVAGVHQQAQGAGGAHPHHASAAPERGGDSRAR